ncbi:hypothetical protein [Pedobacter sp. FW305-3-2-15-E-R2A2]|uniref:hypothetical protein n=1 Tax=Pedobacter sp. FW305-3-2-15-E-R2A2 TaxID=3140251 RepID=UPI0031405863
MKEFRGVAVLLLLLTVGLISGCKKNKDGLPASDIDYYKVWDEAPHNGFTDLTLFKGKFYLVFREGTSHGSNDGAIRILKSDDGKSFSAIARFADEQFDLRDPKIVNMGDSLLYLQYGMADRGKGIMRNGIKWSKNGDEWESGRFTSKDKWWLWGVSMVDKELMSIGYSFYKNDYNNLYVSKKLGHYDEVGSIQTGNLSSGETSLASNKDTIFCAIRATHYSLPSYIGYATKKKLKDWKCFSQNPKLILGGPKMFFLPNRKLYLLTRSANSGSLQTDLFLVDRKTFELSYILTLPSSGDNGYGGIAFDKKNLFISYYSTFNSKSQILIARFPLSQFK